MVNHHIARVSVIGAVARIDRAEPTVVHAFLHGKVDDRFVITVVYARETGKVALAVDDLQFVDHLGGDILAGYRGVVTEELLAVDENLFHFLAVGGDLAVTAHLDARQTLEQVLDHGIGLGLIGVGIEFDGILLDNDGTLHAHDHRLLEHDGVGVHLHHADVHVPAVCADSDVLDDVIITHIREAQQVFASLDTLDVEYTVIVGRRSLDHGAVLVRHEKFDRCAKKFGGILGVHQYAVNNSVMSSKRQHATHG